MRLLLASLLLAVTPGSSDYWGDWVARQCYALGDPPIKNYSNVSPDAETYEGVGPGRYMGANGFMLRCGKYTWAPATWEHVDW